MTKTQELISAAEVMRMTGWKHRSSLTRAVQSGRIAPALSGEGKTSTQFFRRSDVEALLAKGRAA